MEGKLKDVRFRLSAQRREVDQTNQTRDTRVAEITLLQQQLQVLKANKSSQRPNETAFQENAEALHRMGRVEGRERETASEEKKTTLFVMSNHVPIASYITNES